jgi:hypothetical protein
MRPTLSRSQNRGRMTGSLCISSPDRPSTISKHRARTGRPNRGATFIFNHWANLSLIAAQRSRSCASLHQRSLRSKSKRSRRCHSINPNSPAAAIRTRAIYKFSPMTCWIFSKGGCPRMHSVSSQSRWKTCTQSIVEFRVWSGFTARTRWRLQLRSL